MERKKLEGWKEKLLNPYDWLEPKALIVKTYLQMMVGIAIAVLLFAYLVGWNPLKIEGKNPLSIVSYGLMFAAGIELAYMLFTRGPDEAVDPVILGLASALLLELSQGDFTWIDAAVVPGLCGSIGLMFWTKSRFFQKAGDKPEAKKKTPARTSRSTAATTAR
jgi:hypothetical protein